MGEDEDVEDVEDDAEDADNHRQVQVDSVVEILSLPGYQILSNYRMLLNYQISSDYQMFFSLSDNHRQVQVDCVVETENSVFSICYLSSGLDFV